MHDLTEVSGKRQQMTHVWPLLAVGMLGLALAVAAWVAVSVWEKRLAKAKFNDVAGDYATVLQNGFDHYVDEIRAVRAFYDASTRSTPRSSSSSRVESSTAMVDNPMRLIWCPRVGRR